MEWKISSLGRPLPYLWESLLANRIPPDRLLQKPTDSAKNGGLETSERNLSSGPLPGHKKRLTIAFMNRSLLSRWINQCWPFTYLKNGSMVSLSCHKIPQPKSGTVLQPCLLGYPPQLRRLSILAAISQYNSATSNASTVSRPFTLPEK
ncbi:hypothetical protein F2Q69_00008284 [Brassica cretica]|uniref:Uncharacterized protein n=1 Tax=Brassica cretica TaxID=69181 RepID=A0A8S9PLE0_BRACR|nr:hypothetical protein F2Q69_00008284 [Brassica cretica]